MTPESLYEALLAHYGRQNWWPAEHPFEVMVGAILVQQTAWRNAAAAVDRLRARSVLHWNALAAAELDSLQEWVRPAGFYRLKARRLRGLARFVRDAGGIDALKRRSTAALRRQLLALEGVGPETADAILLYAFGRPVFVVDAYALRVFERLGGAGENRRGAGKPRLEVPREIRLGDHGTRLDPNATRRVDGAQRLDVWLRRHVAASLAGADKLNEFHALIVEHGKRLCRKKPLCGDCFLSVRCAHAERIAHGRRAAS